MITLEQAIACVEQSTQERWKKEVTKDIEEDIAFFRNKVQNDLADAIIARLKNITNNTQV